MKLLVNVGSQWKNCGNDVFRRSFGDFFPLKKLYFVPPMCIMYKVFVVIAESRTRLSHLSFMFHAIFF